MEKIWITSDAPADHTVLWEPNAVHGKQGIRMRGGEVMQAVETDHVKAQIKDKVIRKATDAEVAAARKDQREEAKAEAAAP